MPNHIKNRLEIIGDNFQVEIIRNFLKGKPFDDGSECLIDFNNIIPMPEDLHVDDMSNAPLDLEQKYKSNIEKYGYRTWYDWSIANWNTKWNAYSQELESYNVILFETAWSGVPKLISEISSKFPDVKLYYEYSDEDTSYNCGYGTFQNGDDDLICLDGGSKESYELAFKLSPEIQEYYYFENEINNYKYKDDE